MRDKKLTFLDYSLAFLKWRKYIIINSFIVCVIAAIISLIIPKTFTAKTTILPPSSEDGFGISQLLNNLPIGALGMAAPSDETNLFLAIFDSRTLKERIVNRFNLVEVYETETMEKTIEALEDKYDVKINDDATISLFASAQTGYFSGKEGDDEARKFSKNLASTFIEELDKINSNLKSVKARNSRLFIEKRYNQNLEDLKNAEEEFKKFQQTYGVIALPEQTAAAIEVAAELKAEITLKEIEVGVLSQYLNSTHSDLLRAKSELHQLKKKYDELKTGPENEESSGQYNNQKIFLPFNDVPELGVQYVRLFREVTIQEKLLEFILPEYEQAKIQEARDSPTIVILDPATEPERKSKPKRMILVLFAGFLCVCLYAMVTYISINLQHVKETDYDRFEKINSALNALKPNRWFK